MPGAESGPVDTEGKGLPSGGEVGARGGASASLKEGRGWGPAWSAEEWSGGRGPALPGVEPGRVDAEGEGLPSDGEVDAGGGASTSLEEPRGWGPAWGAEE